MRKNVGITVESGSNEGVGGGGEVFYVNIPSRREAC